MPSRRTFVTSMFGAGAALPMFREQAIAQVTRAREIAGTASAAAVAEDEAYWGQIQRAFDVDRTMINLNNGGVCPAPTHVLEAMIRDLRFSNELPVYHMWQVLEPRIESVRRDLANDFGCDPEELAITRNASEAIEIMIFGLDLKAGDEVLITDQNYPRMIHTWSQRVRREGIVLKQLSFQVPPPSQEYLVDLFRNAITPRTRVIEITHINNLSGPIFPVKEIVEMARPLGIDVLVDGAHAYAHFPFTHADLGCDFYGASLHKWLLAPIGTGFLYIRRDRIRKHWPLMAAHESLDDNVRKYEEIGTHPAANHNAIAVALSFHRSIGADRKIARLRYLRDRWAKRLLAESDRVRIYTRLDSPYSGAIALVGVEGLDYAKLGSWLMSNHRIVTTGIGNPGWSGLRITPNVYTTLDEVDFFADKMLEAIRKGVA